MYIAHIALCHNQSHFIKSEKCSRFYAKCFSLFLELPTVLSKKARSATALIGLPGRIPEALVHQGASFLHHPLDSSILEDDPRMTPSAKSSSNLRAQRVCYNSKSRTMPLRTFLSSQVAQFMSIVPLPL